MDSFDYIIVGGGASGLLLAEAMGNDPWFAGKRIALIEKEAEKSNDRTWCFWEAGAGPFDGIAAKSWEAIRFRGSDFEKRVSLLPMRYKMIRGEDFYRDFHARLRGMPQVQIIYAEVLGFQEWEDQIQVETDRGEVAAEHVFSSIYLGDFTKLMQPYPLIWQHFAGWRIQTEQPVFDPDAATFMDFGIPQQGHTCFMYILPESATEALVEYTLFSADLLPDEAYQAALTEYVEGQLRPGTYRILEREAGKIPMTCNNFSAANSERLHHIGLAGGWAKPSTGYAFANTVRNTERLLTRIKQGKSPALPFRKDRFWYYDLLMLDILHSSNAEGSRIFEQLFRKRDPRLILAFLQEDTSLAEDLRIIAACPTRLFLRAFLRRLRVGC